MPPGHVTWKTALTIVILTYIMSLTLGRGTLLCFHILQGISYNLIMHNLNLYKSGNDFFKHVDMICACRIFIIL